LRQWALHHCIEYTENHGQSDHVEHLVMHFFFSAPTATEIYALSLHDALPISTASNCSVGEKASARMPPKPTRSVATSCCVATSRSEEHTSELQSRGHLVCRLLLEKKKNQLLTERSTSQISRLTQIARYPLNTT